MHAGNAFIGVSGYHCQIMGRREGKMKIMNAHSQ